MSSQLTAPNTTIKKGDMVQIMAGRERGKTGKVLRVLSARTTVIVEKLNMVKRHAKPTQKNQLGGIVEKEAPLNISNVLLLCPKCNRGVRIGRSVKNEKKQRVCKKCGEAI